MKPIMIYITAAIITTIYLLITKLLINEWITFYQITVLFILNMIFILLTIMYDNEVK